MSHVAIWHRTSAPLANCAQATKNSSAPATLVHEDRQKGPKHFRARSAACGIARIGQRARAHWLPGALTVPGQRREEALRPIGVLGCLASLTPIRPDYTRERSRQRQ